MVCLNCNSRMGCRYTTPMGKQLRFRVYKCKMCGGFTETVELARAQFEALTLETKHEIVKRMARAKSVQMAVIKKLRPPT